MKKMKLLKLLSEAFSLLCMLLFGSAFFLAPACAYIAPVASYMAQIALSVSGKTLDAQTKAAIAGIRVSLLQSGGTNTTATSASDGSYTLYLSTATNGIFALAAGDVDGASNGAYSNRTVGLKVPAVPFATNLDIELSKTN